MSDDLPKFDLSNLQILVIDDNKYMQLLLQNVLRIFNIRRIMTADNGAAGLEIMKTFQPDVIICDWSMDILDGIEFTRSVRNDIDNANPYIPIIMLTGYSEARQIYEARDAGITEYLVKPISAEMVYERICRAIERPRQFVKTKTFFGPDRRRSKPTKKTNKGRRKEDTEESVEQGAEEGTNGES